MSFGAARGTSGRQAPAAGSVPHILPRQPGNRPRLEEPALGRGSTPHRPGSPTPTHRESLAGQGEGCPPPGGKGYCRRPWGLEGVGCAGTGGQGRGAMGNETAQGRPVRCLWHLAQHPQLSHHPWSPTATSSPPTPPTRGRPWPGPADTSVSPGLQPVQCLHLLPRSRAGHSPAWLPASTWVLGPRRGRPALPHPCTAPTAPAGAGRTLYWPARAPTYVPQGAPSRPSSGQGL